MINVSQDKQKVKEEFFSSCRDKKIPTHNKAALLYQLSRQLETDKEDGQLRQLLLLALADCGVLLNYFEAFDVEEEGEAYQRLKKNYLKLEEDDRQQECLLSKWKEIQTFHDSISKVDAYYDIDETDFAEETNRAVYLYRKFMEVSEKASPELYNNLHRFICMTKRMKEYRLVTPLFLFQLMVRHTGRLAVKENLDVSLKSLWAYKQYRIDKNNGKNFKRYKLYIRLFSRLCKAYRDDGGVDLELCRCGFAASSNLSEWIMDVQPKKSKKALTQLFRDLLEADMSCIGICEPESYSPNAIFGVSQKEERRYMEDFWEDYDEVEQFVTEHVLEHIEYVLHWMEYLYVDAAPLLGYVDEIYRECIPKLPEEKSWMESCIRMHIYEIVRNMLERGVRAKVVSVFARYGEERG